MNELSTGLVVALLAASLTAALCPGVIAFVRSHGAMSLPEERSLHTKPTPRGGGAAPALAALAVGLGAVAFGGPDPLALGLLVAGAGFAVIGLVEDLHGISPLPRLFLQVAAASAAASLLAPDLLIGLGVAWWLVAYANAFNFMDGINGIAVASVVLACATWVVAGTLADAQLLVVGSAVLAAAAIGFWPFNVPTARIFLGDVGSYFFGAALAALAVVGVSAGVNWLMMLGPLTIVLADTGFTLVRRVLAGEPLHLPHKTHVYQRLVTGGCSHLRATATVTAFGVGCAALGFVGGPLGASSMALVVVCYLVVLPRFVVPQRGHRLLSRSDRSVP